MPPEIDATGPRVNINLQCGSTYSETWSDIYQADDVTLIDNITFARITFREGTLGSQKKTLGSAVAGLTVSPTTDGRSISWSVAPAQTRLFDPTKDYCRQIEFDTAAGDTFTLVKGDVAAERELVT